MESKFFEGVSLYGKGVFRSNQLEFLAEFSLHTQLSHIAVLAADPTIRKTIDVINSEAWSLEGTLTDERRVQCKNLFVVEAHKSSVEFLPTEGICIGDRPLGLVREALFPLKGMYNGGFAVEVDGWTIIVEGGSNSSKIASRRAKTWKVQVVGRNLSLAHSQAGYHAYEEVAVHVMHLLSLACGNGITSDQHQYQADEGSFECWRRMKGGEFGPNAIVPDWKLGSFISQVLPTWMEWSAEKRGQARLAITNINLSGAGYLGRMDE